MNKGYWIASVTVTDDAPYRHYVAANAAVFESWGGRFIVRGGQFQTVQGQAGARQVVIEFASYQQALDCYNSSEYQDILKLLLAGATLQLTIVEGA